MYLKKDLYRALAVTIDSFFVNFIYNVLFESSGFDYINFNLMLFVFLCYYALFDFINNGASIGKLVLNISIKKETSIKEKLSHTFMKIVSIYITPLTIIFYLIKGEILHDYLEKPQKVV